MTQFVLGDFVHPREIVVHPSLSAQGKRELLSAWASDTHTVPSRPTFRWAPGTPGPVAVSHILGALRELDRHEETAAPMLAFMIPGSRSGERRIR